MLLIAKIFHTAFKDRIVSHGISVMINVLIILQKIEK